MLARGEWFFVGYFSIMWRKLGAKKWLPVKRHKKIDIAFAQMVVFDCILGTNTKSIF